MLLHQSGSLRRGLHQDTNPGRASDLIKRLAHGAGAVYPHASQPTEKDTVSDIIQRLLSTRERTSPYFDLDDAHLDLSYGPAPWGVGYSLRPLADTDSVLEER